MTKELFKKGEVYPPQEHAERIERYSENKELFKGNHYEIFSKYNLSRRSKYYISVNLAGLISKKSADFLIGDGIQVSAGKKEGSNEQQALERIYEQNDLDIKLYESALANSYRGDSFFKVRYGQEHGGEFPSSVDKYKVIIDSIPAKYVFTELSEYDGKTIIAYHIAVPVRIVDNKPSTYPDTWKLEVESHYAGRIEYRNFYMRGVSTDINGFPISWKIGDPMDEEEIEETNVPMPLVVHIPNYTTDDNALGLDDLTELKPLFDELNNRFTQIASIMDKHSDPAMAIPPNIMQEDEDGRVYFNVSESKVFEVDERDITPKYITWNGQLNEAYQEIDKLTNQILTVAELPQVALGMGDTGTSGSSGFAIKWRMNSLLSKVKRKRKYYEKGLKRLFIIAQHLEQIAGIADYETVETPKFIFSDGLPVDEGEQTSIAIQKTGGAILQSQKAAIMKLGGLTEEQALEEIKQIEREQDKEEHRTPKGEPDFFNTLKAEYDDREEDKEREDMQENESNGETD